MERPPPAPRSHQPAPGGLRKEQRRQPRGRLAGEVPDRDQPGCGLRDLWLVIARPLQGLARLGPRPAAMERVGDHPG